MTVSEIMQSYCVKVNGGSGVLVNAMTQEYSYVLTAAHVITEALVDIVVHDYQNNLLNVLAVLTDPKENGSELVPYDCVILKVAHQERVAQKNLPASNLSSRAELTLVGFPTTERESQDPIKFYDGHMTSVTNELVIFTIDGVPGIATITGMSGGGVYHIKNEIPLLIGVEFQMDSTGQEQQYGRVQCYSLVRFEEIITANSSAPMIPAYLECFSRVRDRIFSFNVIDQNNVSNLKLELERVADYLIVNGLPPPYKVMEQYHSDLLVDPTKLDELKNHELWVAYLEFLVISALIDQSGSVDDAYMKGLERKRRLIYTSDDANWIRRLEELLKTARRLLDNDGTLIVASPELAASLLPPTFRLESVISNIAVVPNQGPFPAIDMSESAIYTSYKLTHLEGLRNKCVVDSEDEYSRFQAGRQQSDLLREKLREIIN